MRYEIITNATLLQCWAMNGSRGHVVLKLASCACPMLQRLLYSKP
jgi:hypothetical protein